jgi:hypothetical protein
LLLPAAMLNTLPRLNLTVVHDDAILDRLCHGVVSLAPLFVSLPATLSTKQSTASARLAGRRVASSAAPRAEVFAGADTNLKTLVFMDHNCGKTRVLVVEISP